MVSLLSQGSLCLCSISLFVSAVFVACSLYVIMSQRQQESVGEEERSSFSVLDDRTNNVMRPHNAVGLQPHGLVDGMRALNRSYFNHFQTLDLDQVCSGPPFVDVRAACEYQRQQQAIYSRCSMETHPVVVFGSNESSELGFPPKLNESFENYLPTLNESLGEFRFLSAGSTHTLGLVGGIPYAWGNSDEGQTAYVGELDYTLHQITGFRSRDGQHNDDHCIVDCAGGNCHSAFLASSGRLYIAGSYKDCNEKSFTFSEEADALVRFGKAKSPVEIPLRGLQGKATRVFSGQASNFDIIQVQHPTGEHSLLTFGFGNYGELARGEPIARDKYFDAAAYSEALEKEALKKKDANAVEEDDAESVNENDYFDLRVILEELLTPKPVIYSFGSPKKNVLSVAAGAYHLLVAAREPGQSFSHVYSAGDNNAGQLGHPDKKACFDKLTLVRFVPSFVYCISPFTESQLFSPSPPFV